MTNHLSRIGGRGNINIVFELHWIFICFAWGGMPRLQAAYRVCSMNVESSFFLLTCMKEINHMI